MKLLFDDCASRRLAPHFAPHAVTFADQRGWKGLRNSALLDAAQHDYNALITTDTNLYHQNVVANYAIAVVVLRGFRNSLEYLIEAVPEALQLLQVIQPGQVFSAYADEKLRQLDKAKGKGFHYF